MDETVYLWYAHISTLIPHAESRFYALLAPDEQARAQRFQFEKPRQQFIAARGMLRTVLADTLNTSPDKIEFAYGQRGKPAVPGTDLRFNLAHSEEVILLSIVNGHEIGVDVEHIHPLPNLVTMARDHFSEYEQSVLFSLPEPQQLRGFFTCWTRKEAYIKATGDGFSLPLRDFDVTLAPGEAPKMLRAMGDNRDRWQMHHIDLGSDYIGAVCVEAETHLPVKMMPFSP